MKGIPVLPWNLHGRHVKRNEVINMIMEAEIIIPLIVILVLAVLVFKFVAKVFLKLILVIILAAAAIYMFIKAGMV